MENLTHCKNRTLFSSKAISELSQAREPELQIYIYIYIAVFIDYIYDNTSSESPILNGHQPI
jgi:hypothetical protein